MLIKVPEILNGAMDFDSFYSLYRKEKNPIVMRILFYIFDLYHGLSVPEASKKHRITNETGYKYAKVWRTQGIDGLIPDYSNNGKPSKMTEEQIEIVTKQVRQGKVHNVDDLLNFILKNFKIEYGKDWAYGFFRDLGLKDGIKYPLPRKEKKLPVKKESNRDKEPEIILNNGYECIKVSEKLYFTRYVEDLKILKDFIGFEKNNKHLKRYIFMNSLNEGIELKTAGDICNISITTARRWLKLWNESGLDGLKIEWGEGRPALLTNEQIAQLKEYMRNNLVTQHSEVHKYILTHFNVDYSLYQIYRIVKKLKFN